MASEPIILVLPPAVVAALLPVPGRAELTGGTGRQERDERRRLILRALADQATGWANGHASGRSTAPTPDATGRAPPPLIDVDADGCRRLGGTSLFASVAERDGWAAAALSPWPVGVDLESISEAEAARSAILGGVDAVDLAQWHGLAGLWAAREAVLKAVGRDLTRDPGGWRFAAGRAQAHGIPPHRVDLMAFGPVVAAVAYAGA